MRESRTYGSVRGGYRKVSVYSIIEVIMNRKNTNLQLTFVALAACLIYAISAGIRSNYGTMITAISDHTGVAYASVSFILAIAQLSFGIMQPVFGLLALKRSNAFVLEVGAVLLTAGLLMIPASHSFLMLLLFLGIIMPSGTGALSFGIIMGAVTPILGQKKAPVASGFVSASSGVGGTVLAPVIQGLISWSGLWAAVIFLCIPALILIPVSAWMTHAGKGADTAESKDDSSLKETLAEAFKDKNFIYLALAFFTCGFHMTIIATHFYPQIVSMGLSESAAAFAISAYGIATMAGSVISGVLISRFRMKNVLALWFGLRPIIILVFLLLPKTIPVMYVFAVMLGLTGASTVPPTSGITGKLFGTAKLGALFGVIFLFHQIGGFLSSWIGGVVVSSGGSYSTIWILSAVLATGAALISMRISEE